MFISISNELGEFESGMVAHLFDRPQDPVFGPLVSVVSGGVGTILGTIIGAFIMSVLINGLRIMSVAQEWQMVLTGVIIILAVYTDNLRRKKQ